MNKCVCTTEAASLLGISSRRLRQLLEKGRVRGAYKSGKFWIIPLFNNLPQITKGSRGPKGKWRTNRAPAIAKINVNRNHIGSNIHKSPEERKPVISLTTPRSKETGILIRMFRDGMNPHHSTLFSY